jgi:aminoglycoside 2'-N-acetyltransferase I
MTYLEHGMKIEVKTAEQWNDFEKARQDCVVLSSLYAYLTGIKWASPDAAVMVWVEDDMVSNVHIVKREIKVGRQKIIIGGIGNIATKVEWRKQGYSSLALIKAEEYLVDPLQVSFGLMISTPELIPRYSKRGWKVVADSLKCEQPEGKYTLQYPVMILPVKQKEWPAGPIDVCGLPW